MALSAQLLIASRTTCLGVASPTAGQGSPLLISNIENVPTDLATGKIGWRHFLYPGSFLSSDSIWCQIDKKKTSQDKLDPALGIT